MLLRNQAAALVGLVVLGAATFVVVPLLQTWLMTQVGQAAAGLVAAVNISVAGVAGALGAGLGGAVLAVGLGLVAIGPIAALPVLGAARCGVRPPQAPGRGAVPGLTRPVALTWADRRTGGPARMTRPHDDPATEPVTAQHAFEQDPEIDGDFLDEEWLEPRSTSRLTKVLVGLVLVAFGFLAGVSVGRGAADAADAAATRSTASPGGPGGGVAAGVAAARARRARAAAGPVAPAGATGVARGGPPAGPRRTG